MTLEMVKGPSAETTDEEIRHRARMSSVSIRKRMDENEAVMQAYTQFVRVKSYAFKGTHQNR